MAYVGWKNLKITGADNPDAVKAAIGRKKYGKKRFQKAAAKGKKMRGMKPLHKSKRRSAREGAEALMAKE